MEIENRGEEEVEEEIYSKAKENVFKIKEFKEYLVNHDVLLAYVKFLVSLRSAKEKPEEPLKALRDYFGEIKDSSWTVKENLEKDIENLKEDNQKQLNEIENLKQLIILKKEEIKKKEEEERIRLEEEQAKKDKKKPPPKK